MNIHIAGIIIHIKSERLFTSPGIRGICDSNHKTVNGAAAKLLKSHESKTDGYCLIDPSHHVVVHFTQSFYQPFSINGTNLIEPNCGRNLQSREGWLNCYFIWIRRVGDFARDCSHDRRHTILVCNVVLITNAGRVFLISCPNAGSSAVR